MNEDYLQRIWSQSRIPSPHLKLIDGSILTVKHPGKHNTSHSGPDFKQACVEFDNLEFHGAVEIHVNGSDWYKHKHHEDEAYNAVVLHVVYNNDVPVVQKGFTLPTLELKEFIDLEHFRKSLKVDELNTIRPCSNSIENLDPIYWSSMKTKALIHKFNEKINFNVNIDEEEVLYQLLASVFGMGINKNAFIELAQSLPWTSLQELDALKRKQLILVTSGCAQGDYSKRLENEYQWHFKGTRPGNFPSVRIPQFATLMSVVDINDLANCLCKGEIVEEIDAYLKRLTQKAGVEVLPKSLRNHLFMNGIAPFLYWKSEQLQDEAYLEMAIEVLSQLPAEKNSILRDWKQIGITAKNAFDSQGLIALNRYYCSLKKCLSCEVGLKVLNRAK